MAKAPKRSLFESAKQCKENIIVAHKSTSSCNKWVVAAAVLGIGICMLCFKAEFLWDAGRFASESIAKSGIYSLSEKLRGSVPLAEGGTSYHLMAVQDAKERRKREIVSTGGIITMGGSGSGDSGSGTSDTTEPAEQTTEAATSANSGDDTTSGSGDTSEATTQPAEISRDETTAMEISGDTTEASGVTTDESEVPGEATTQPLEMSGDETTAPIEGSAFTTAGGPEEGTTDSMFEESGSGTTDATESAEQTTETSETATMTEPVDETTQPTATDAVIEETTFPSAFSTVAVAETTFEATTAVIGGGGDDELLVPLYIAIIAGVAGIILGVLLVFAVIALAKWWRKRKSSVTPTPTPSQSTPMLRDDDLTRPSELNWLMSREDTLMKAMALGQISVLEFALRESDAAGLRNENPRLMSDAESKLNTWKRNRTQLEASYRDKDLNTMDEFMARFEESGMKDDTGTYQKCVDLKSNIKHAELSMENAVAARNESALVSSVGQYESLQLQQPTMASSVPYQNALLLKEEMRQEKLLQSRTWDAYRMDLRTAVFSRQPAAISAAVDRFLKAEVPDEHGDLSSAQNALETIEAERQENLENAQKKLEDASFSRDQEALRQSIHECKKFGATEESLKTPENLLRVIEREDALLAELKTLTFEGDMPKLASAIVVFKTPTVEMIDKTGDLAKAEEVLEKLQQEESMRKTKEDVYRRLKNAIAIGDPTAMSGMITALQGLAVAGEAIDKSLLALAIGKLEACRGQVDYRKRMEAVKTGLTRTIALENIPQTEDLVDQMSQLAEDKDYTMTTDDARVLDDSRTALNSMKNKKALVDEIALVRPDLSLALIPANLPKLNEAIEKMSNAKKGAQPFDGLFSEEDSVLLADAKINAKTLEHKVNVMGQARERLDLAIESRDYTNLKHAIRNAIQAPFIEKKELIEPRKLAVFLDPKARRMAVKKAMRARNTRGLELALQDFQDAKVQDEDLLLKGERTLNKLRKRERRDAKEERRKLREDAKRADEIKRLTGILQSAIGSRNIEHLQLALEEFEESGFDDEDIPVANEAEELFDDLKVQDLKERLTDSIKRRDVMGLENAIDDADYGGYVMDVKEEYDIAKDLLFHLRELNELRAAISEMNRSLISEIHKYPTPPAPVHQVMGAVFTMLGESPKTMKNWSEIQGLLGKLGHNSISRRVRICVPGDIPSAAIKNAEQQIAGLKLNELSDISKGASTFYAWTKCMIKEHSLVSNEQKALADIELPDLGIPDRPQTSVGDYAWVEKNA